VSRRSSRASFIVGALIPMHHVSRPNVDAVASVRVEAVPASKDG